MMDIVFSMMGILLIVFGIVAAVFYFMNRSAVAATLASPGSPRLVNPIPSVRFARWVEEHQKYAGAGLAGMILAGLALIGGLWILAAITAAAIVLYGVYSSKSTKGPEFAAKVVGAGVCIVAILYLLLGIDGTNTLFSKIRTTSVDLTKSLFASKSLKYMGVASGGTYTVNENEGLIFVWPDPDGISPQGYCFRANGSGIRVVGNDKADKVSVYPDGNGKVRSFQAKLLKAGETWKGYTC